MALRILGKNKRSAFTLIEIIIYIALLGIFLSAATISLWDIILGNVKSSVQQEVQESLRYSSYRILYEIRSATGFNASPGFPLNLADDPDNILSLVASAPNYPVQMRVQNGILQIKRGTLDWGNATGSAVEVTNLTLSLIDDPTTKASIQFLLTIRYINPSGRSQWEKEATFQGSATLR